MGRSPCLHLPRQDCLGLPGLSRNIDPPVGVCCGISAGLVSSAMGCATA